MLLNDYRQSEGEALVSLRIDDITSTECRMTLQNCMEQKLSSAGTDGESGISITATAAIDIQ